MAHDSDHVKRVVKLALYIAKKEGADLEVVKVAAELHDIERGKKNHAIESAKTAEKILRERGYDENFIAKVKHCIEAHSFSSQAMGVKPESLEAKVLSDADKLDAIGAIGIARAFLFAGEKGLTIGDVVRHFEEKLLKLIDCMYTDTAKEIAKERHEFLKEFYEKLKSELISEQECKDEVS